MAQPREFLASRGGILALVLTILGAVFLAFGAVMLVSGMASQVADAPFARRSTLSGIGLVFLVFGGVVGFAGIVLWMRRRQTLLLRKQLRTHGYPTNATIVKVSQDFRARVNRRHPWRIEYRYEVGGVAYSGSETTFEKPEEYVAGATVVIRYAPYDPAQSALER